MRGESQCSRVESCNPIGPLGTILVITTQSVISRLLRHTLVLYC